MQRVRSLIVRRPVMLAGLLLCALLMRLLIPADYMPAMAGGVVTLQLCPGTMPADPPAAAMHAAMPGMHHDVPDEHPKAEQPCGYAGLASPALASADASLLASALAFAFLLALGRAVSPPAIRRARLRPPLRAPPVPA